MAGRLFFCPSRIAWSHVDACSGRRRRSVEGFKNTYQSSFKAWFATSSAPTSRSSLRSHPPRHWGPGKPRRPPAAWRCSSGAVALPWRLRGEAFQLDLRLPPTDEANRHLALRCPFDVHGPDVFPTGRVNQPPAPLLGRESTADLYRRTANDLAVGESDLDAFTLSVVSQWPSSRRGDASAEPRKNRDTR